MQLFSEDMTDLTDMLKQCGLPAVTAAEDASEAPAKRARAGPCDNPKKTPREIAKLANPALIARLANSVYFLEEAASLKNGGDGSLANTIPVDPELLRERSAPPPPADPKNERERERHRQAECSQKPKKVCFLLCLLLLITPEGSPWRSLLCQPPR